MPKVNHASPTPATVTKEQFFQESKGRAKLWLLGTVVSVVPGIREILSNVGQGHLTAGPITAAVCGVSSLTAIGFYDLMRLRRLINRDKWAGIATGWFYGLATITVVLSGAVSLFYPEGVEGGFTGH